MSATDLAFHLECNKLWRDNDVMCHSTEILLAHLIFLAWGKLSFQSLDRPVLNAVCLCTQSPPSYCGYDIMPTSRK